MNNNTDKKIESTHVDYKLNLEIRKPKSWLMTISAFANTIIS